MAPNQLVTISIMLRSVDAFHTWVRNISWNWLFHVFKLIEDHFVRLWDSNSSAGCLLYYLLWFSALCVTLFWAEHFQLNERTFLEPSLHLLSTTVKVAFFLTKEVKDFAVITSRRLYYSSDVLSFNGCIHQALATKINTFFEE